MGNGTERRTTALRNCPHTLTVTPERSTLHITQHRGNERTHCALTSARHTLPPTPPPRRGVPADQLFVDSLPQSHLTSIRVPIGNPSAQRTPTAYRKTIKIACRKTIKPECGGSGRTRTCQVLTCTHLPYSAFSAACRLLLLSNSLPYSHRHLS